MYSEWCCSKFYNLPFSAPLPLTFLKHLFTCGTCWFLKAWIIYDFFFYFFYFQITHFRSEWYWLVKVGERFFFVCALYTFWLFFRFGATMQRRTNVKNAFCWGSDNEYDLKCSSLLYIAGRKQVQFCAHFLWHSDAHFFSRTI